MVRLNFVFLWQCLVDQSHYPFVWLWATSWTIAVVNLTLIDLPGLTKVAVGKQLVDMSLLSMITGYGSS